MKKILYTIFIILLVFFALPNIAKAADCPNGQTVTCYGDGKTPPCIIPFPPPSTYDSNTCGSGYQPICSTGPLSQCNTNPTVVGTGACCITIGGGGATCQNDITDCRGPGQQTMMQACGQIPACQTGIIASTTVPQTTNIQDDLKNKIIQIPKPLQISIPGLDFTKIDSVDAQGYLYIPWIAEYISAAYNFAIGIVSIIAVIMIIVQGVRIITSAGGEAQKDAYNKILQAVIGLAIAWGSFFILNTVNPGLTQFQALKIKFVQPMSIDELLSIDGGNVPPPISGSVPTGNCDQYDNLFQKYASCLGADSQSFKAVATVESGCKATAVNSIGFQGLFQTKPKYCTAVFNNSKYKQFASYCTSEYIAKPEFSIAFFTQMQKANIANIKKSCPNATPEQQGFALHAFNNVPAVAKVYIKNGCTNYNDFVTGFVNYFKGTRVFQNTPTYAKKFPDLLNDETAFLTAVGTWKMQVAVKAGSIFASLGGNLMSASPSGQCPLDDPNLKF